MIIHDCEQGTHEWQKLRLGIPTASNFDRLLTPSKLQPSAQRHDYRIELVAEWLLGEPLDVTDTGWMERGRELETEARKWYAFDRDVSVDHVGFVTTDDGDVGGSPDGLVRDNKIGLEIKCLSAKNHVARMLEDGYDGSYRGQIQGGLWLTGYEAWDLVFYHHQLPKIVYRIEPDPEYHEALDEVMRVFLPELRENKERLAEHRIVREADPAQEAAADYMPVGVG